MRDYDVCLSLRALRPFLGDSVRITHPVTMDILFSIFQGFDWSKLIFDLDFRVSEHITLATRMARSSCAIPRSV